METLSQSKVQEYKTSTLSNNQYKVSTYLYINQRRPEMITCTGKDNEVLCKGAHNGTLPFFGALSLKLRHSSCRVRKGEYQRLHKFESESTACHAKTICTFSRLSQRYVHSSHSFAGE